MDVNSGLPRCSVASDIAGNSGNAGMVTKPLSRRRSVRWATSVKRRPAPSGFLTGFFGSIILDGVPSGNDPFKKLSWVSSGRADGVRHENETLRCQNGMEYGATCAAAYTMIGQSTAGA